MNIYKLYLLLNSNNAKVMFLVWTIPLTAVKLTNQETAKEWVEDFENNMKRTE